MTMSEGKGDRGRLPGGEGDPLTQLRETQTMLEENVRECATAAELLARVRGDDRSGG